MSATSGYSMEGTVDPGQALTGMDIDARALTLGFQEEDISPADLSDAVGTFHLQGICLMLFLAGSRL